MLGVDVRDEKPGLCFAIPLIASEAIRSYTALSLSLFILRIAFNVSRERVAVWNFFPILVTSGVR